MYIWIQIRIVQCTVFSHFFAVQGKDRAIAGVREYIFVWDVTTEQLLKQFQAHYARIIHMSALTEGQHRMHDYPVFIEVEGIPWR